MVGDALKWWVLARRSAARVAVLGVLAAAAACTVDELQVTTGPQTGLTGATAPTALIGSWVHVTYTQTAAGVFAHEILWRFDANRRAARTTVTRNLDTGLSDSFTETGTWRVRGGLLTVVFDPPHTGTVQFRFTAFRQTLLLDSREFQRIR